MPRSRGDKEYLIPIKGLNTEATSLNFPQDSFVDGLNCELRYNPLRLQWRNSIVPLTPTFSSSAYNVPENTTIDTSYYLWEAPNNDPSLPILCVKIGGYLHFYDVSVPDSISIIGKRLELTDVVSGTSVGTIANAAAKPMDFVDVKGRLLVVNEAIDPTLVEFDGTSSFTMNAFDLFIRDTLGIEDGTEIDERPATLSEEHEYNLLNQGWSQTRKSAPAGAYSSPISQYFTSKALYPSNADIVDLAMVENTGELIFDPTRLDDLYFGSTPAARGHFIHNAFDMDRETPRTTPITSGGSTGGTGGGGTGGSGVGVIPQNWRNIIPVTVP